jgi:hypothetical protein
MKDTLRTYISGALIATVGATAYGFMILPTAITLACEYAEPGSWLYWISGCWML